MPNPLSLRAFASNLGEDADDAIKDLHGIDWQSLTKAERAAQKVAIGAFRRAEAYASKWQKMARFVDRLNQGLEPTTSANQQKFDKLLKQLKKGAASVRKPWLPANLLLKKALGSKKPPFNAKKIKKATKPGTPRGGITIDDDPFPWIYTGTLETTIANGRGTCNQTRDGFAIEFRADGTVYAVIPMVGTDSTTRGCSDFDFGFTDRNGTYDADAGTFTLEVIFGSPVPGGTFTIGPAGTVAGSFFATGGGSLTWIPRGTRCLSCPPVTLP